MEDPNPKQNPLENRPTPDQKFQVEHWTSGQPSDRLTTQERRAIENGQKKAERDKKEMRRNGFGSHIGTKD